MVIPGVCNRKRCTHPLAHFIINWRLCEPIEYTTALADHGITYGDYCRLLTLLANFSDDISSEPPKLREGSGGSISRLWSPIQKNILTEVNSGNRKTRPLVSRSCPSLDIAHYHKLVQQQASNLNHILEEVSWNWQKRGLPVMVCVSSFSLFNPNRITESFIQILHVPHQIRSPRGATPVSEAAPRLSFIDPEAVEQAEECSVAKPRQRLNRRSLSPPSPSIGGIHLHHHQQLSRDKSKPWPLWPNALPSHKRDMMNEHVVRYGVDPYFRAWVRADVNSRTRCTSYAKYMIEQEDNPFINSRLDYAAPPSRIAIIWDLHNLVSMKWKRQYPSTANRDKYEHNRRLECRKTVENGYRLRIASFSFRHPIYPPHTPEMEELGLTKQSYLDITNHIEDIRLSQKSSSVQCLPQVFKSWRKIRPRRTEDALIRVSEYIRKINSSNKKLVWTIETIPWVYDLGLGRDKKEWQISAWNGEDPLELVLQLEKWGIIEKKLNIDEDE
jgi:hypothetical protein